RRRDCLHFRGVADRGCWLRADSWPATRKLIAAARPCWRENHAIFHSMQQADHSHLRHLPEPKNFGTAFAVGVTLNIAYVVAQIGFGISSHSLALLADAGHNFGDVLGFLLAWGAIYLGRTRSTARRTYGLGRSSILAALV